MEGVRHGRLFHLKVRKNGEARRDAYATLRQRPDGQWQARIGGRLRGHTCVRLTRRQVEAEIDEHYNAALLAAVERMNRS